MEAFSIRFLCLIFVILLTGCGSQVDRFGYPGAVRESHVERVGILADTFTTNDDYNQVLAHYEAEGLEKVEWSPSADLVAAGVFSESEAFERMNGTFERQSFQAPDGLITLGCKTNEDSTRIVIFHDAP